MADPLGGIPSLGSGGGLGGIPTLGGGTRRRRRRPTISEQYGLRTLGVGRGGAGLGPGYSTRKAVALKTSRPSPFLGVVGKVLSAPSNALLGFLDAANSYKGLGKDEAGNRLRLLVTEPQQFFKAIGAGFREIPDAVVNADGIDRVERNLLEKYGSDSFVGRNVGTIAMTMALIADPTLYLSFGATAPARLTARRMLDLAERSSYSEARHIMTRPGKGRGVHNGKRFQTIQEAAEYMHLTQGRPSTMGDALDSMKNISETARTRFAVGKVNLGYRTANYKRGARFMGFTVPKTPELGEYLSVAARGQSEKLHKTVPYQLLLQGVPNHVLHMSNNDRLRAGLWVAATDFRRSNEVLRDRVPEETIQHVLEPLVGVVNDPILAGATRMGLHRKAPQEIADPTLNTLRRRIESVRVRTTNAAVRSGLKQGDVENMWLEMAKKYDDPLDAIAHFAIKAETRRAFHDFRKQILEDPRFAYELPPGGVTKTGKVITGGAVGLDRIPGTVPVTFGKRKFFVPDEVEEVIESMRNTAYQDVQLGFFMRAANWPQNKWKTFATVTNPAFFVMNAIGAMWNNMLAGVINPLDYTRAIGEVYRDRMGKQGTTMLEAAHARSIGGGASFISVEAAGPTRSLLQQFGEEQASVGRAVKERSLGGLRQRATSRPVGVSRGRLAGRRARQAGGLALAATGNPLAVAAFGPEIANIGRSINSSIEDVVRIAPFMKSARDKELKQIIEAFGPIQVPGMKHPGFSKSQQEVMYNIGADISNHFQFDYRELTWAERNFAKTLMPFYTFFKKNFKLQFEQMVQRPRNLEAFNAFTTYMNEEVSDLPDEFKRMLPEYFDNLGAFAMPVPDWARDKMGLPQDQPLYLNPKLPFLTLNMFPPFWTIFQETGEPFPQKLLKASGISTAGGMVGPFSVWGVKTMFEYLTNKQLGLARPIDYQRANSNDWRSSKRDAPGWVKYLPDPLKKLFATETESGRLVATPSKLYILDQLATPFINNLGQSLEPEKATEYQKGQAKADLVSWVTGIRLMPVDMLKMHRSWGYRMIDMLEAKKAETKDLGQVWDPEDEAILKILRADVKQLEGQWDIREEELYGTP